MNALAEIIAKLEAAQEGSRELDEAIVRAVCPTAIVDFYIVGDDEKTVFGGDELDLNKVEVPHFTDSLDSAWTLVPKGWGVSVHMSPPEHDCEQSASLIKGCAPYFDDEQIDGVAKNCILALCIAALRAREAQSK